VRARRSAVRFCPCASAVASERSNRTVLQPHRDQSRVEAAWLAAVAEPTRLKILRALVAGEMTVTELAQACGTEIVNISHHLNAMKSAGLVTDERDAGSSTTAWSARP
jgi:DNA-binding transcriptional ArsR family regulator